MNECVLVGHISAQGEAQARIRWPPPTPPVADTCAVLCCAPQSNGGRASYGVVKVTDPKHTVMSWTAQGLPPGLPYTFTVTPL